MTKILYLLHGRYTGHYNTINEPLEKIVENLIFKIPGIKLGKWKLEVNLFKKEQISYLWKISKSGFACDKTVRSGKTYGFF